MSANARALAALCALALAGCFPDYEVAEGSGGSGEMQYVDAAGRSFAFQINDVPANVLFTHDFEIDTWEVTVRMFRDWLVAERRLPCKDGTFSCPLENGPYGDAMHWRTEWNELAKREHFHRYDNKEYPNPDGNPDPSECYTPKDYGSPEPKTTYEMSLEQGVDELPMTCVSWFEAVAYCAWAGKRLPTQAEWSWARVAHQTATTTYPWGNDPPDCNDAITDSDGKGCGFPVPVGSAQGDITADGVNDLVGSVFEWVWDVSWDNGPPPASQVTNYAGPADNTGYDVSHFRAGGSYIVGNTVNPAQLELLAPGASEAYEARHFYADAGFRCVRSVP